MAIEGPLRELGIQDVLQLLDLARKTGILSVRSERMSDEAVIHFERGHIIFAMRRWSLRRLGQQLLRAGKLTERELERALELQRQDPSQRLGRILLEMGSVSAAELERQIRFQLEETIYDLMAWDEGHFHFEESDDITRGDVAIRVRVDSLLMEGARRIDEWTRLESRIPGVEAVPVLAPLEEGGGTPLELRPGEWEVLAEIDGERDLRRIAADLGQSSFEVARTIYGLVSMGVVQVWDQPLRLTERELEAAMDEIRTLLAAGDFEQAGRRAGELQAAYPERGELARLEGDALMAQGRARAATEAYARAVGLDPASEEAHYALGFAAARIGDFDRAARSWDLYLRLSPAPDRLEMVEHGLEALRVLNELLARGLT